MDVVMKIVLTTCLLSVGITILEMLYPGKKFQKQIRFLFSLVFIISLAVPITGGKFEFPKIDLDYNVDYSYLEEQSEKELKKETEQNISSSLNKKFEAQNIFVKEISVSINIIDNQSISISEVKIICSDNYEKENIKSIVQNEVGAEAKITVTYEGEELHDE